jgi:hypothetical protein
MLLAPDARTMNKGDGWAGCMIICEAGRGRLRLTLRTAALECGRATSRLDQGGSFAAALEGSRHGRVTVITKSGSDAGKLLLSGRDTESVQLTIQ